ncbi:hypothetical protein BHE74_00058782 [Ensete ventricosum]|nr:hypothetical protein GW17_00050048 [Ensete ventricosum]RWW36214.1 hypothetical protein BHE74_00058782 [Ensete ventricosum]
MGQLSYKYEYRIALARFQARYPDLRVDRDSFTEKPEDNSVPMETCQEFDDSIGYVLGSRQVTVFDMGTPSSTNNSVRVHVAELPQHLTLEGGPMSQERPSNLFPSWAVEEAIPSTPSVGYLAALSTASAGFLGPLMAPHAFSRIASRPPSVVLWADQHVRIPGYHCRGQVGIRRTSDLVAL